MKIIKLLKYVVIVCISIGLVGCTFNKYNERPHFKSKDFDSPRRVEERIQFYGKKNQNCLLPFFLFRNI